MGLERRLDKGVTRGREWVGVFPRFVRVATCTPMSPNSFLRTFLERGTCTRSSNHVTYVVHESTEHDVASLYNGAHAYPRTCMYEYPEMPFPFLWVTW